MAVRARFILDRKLANYPASNFAVVVERDTDQALWNGTAFVVPTSAAPVVPGTFPVAFGSWMARPNVLILAIPNAITQPTGGTAWTNGYYNLYLHKYLADGKTLGPAILAVQDPVTAGDDENVS